jgi:two-component system, sensor histidine kinase and response regulator
MSGPGEGDKKPTVLIVDDTPENIALVSSILKGFYRTKAATNGDKALEMAFSANPPDLILLDIMMPGIDGYEVCRRLKANPASSDIPVIFFTSKSRMEDEEMGFQFGAVDYIAKPVSPPIVLARVKTHLDLQTQKRLLLESYEQLVKLEELRDNLVHMIVHDLRSPLTAVIGNLDLLQSLETENFSMEGRQLVEIAMSAAEVLVEMTSSVLDVSRMESMDIKLNMAECELVDIAKRVTTRLAGLARNRKLALTTPSDPVKLRADPDLISRVIQNLVTNAIKFTPLAGEIKLDVESDVDFVRVSVQDSGSGIPPEYQDRVFDKFFQVEAKQHGHKYSTGLGLTFCKLAVEAHGGRIGVNSVPDYGSIFWFELPARGPDLSLSRTL